MVLLSLTKKMLDDFSCHFTRASFAYKDAALPSSDLHPSQNLSLTYLPLEHPPFSPQPVQESEAILLTNQLHWMRWTLSS